jgi:hypothetical protein
MVHLSPVHILYVAKFMSVYIISIHAIHSNAFDREKES